MAKVADPAPSASLALVSMVLLHAHGCRSPVATSSCPTPGLMPNAIPVDMMHAYVIGALQFLVAYYDDLAMVHLDDSPLTGGAWQSG